MQKQRVGYAVVGLGVGREHAKSAAAFERCDLVAVCDCNQDRLQTAVAAYGCTGYTDYEKMLQDERIDVISIATPSGMHADMAIQAAAAGKHCLVEKPLDIDLGKIDRMVAAFSEAGLKLGGVFQRRLEPANRFLKAALDRGDLGKPVFCGAQVAWYRKQSYYDADGGWRGTWAMDGGGSLMNQSVHTFDLIQWLMGPVKSVNAKVGVFAHEIETEDLGVAVLEFASGALGSIMGTTSAYPGLGTHMMLFGTEGSAYLDGKLRKWRRLIDDSEEEEARVLAQLAAGDLTGDASADAQAISALGHQAQVQDMVAAVLDDREPLVPGAAGRPAVEIILAIYQSARTGKQVSLPLS